MTIEQIKNDVAVKHGYEDWVNFIATLLTKAWSTKELINLENEAMQEYARHMCDEQINYNKRMKISIITALSYFESCRDHWEEGESIVYHDLLNSLNTPNVVKP